jgi:hypothetical protein
MKCFKSILAAGAVAASAALTGSVANALTIDFTDNALWSGTSNSSVTNRYTELGGFDVTLVASGGALRFDQAFDGGTKSMLSYCDAGGGPLDCDTDGGGVGDDEVSIGSSQSITATFSKALTVTGFHFLDLFKKVASTDLERAVITFDDATTVTYAGDVDFQNDGGYRFGSANKAGVTSITFTAGPGNDGNGDGDYALAGINVIPLPAAAWLLLGVSGALVAAKRRKTRAAA